MSQRAENERRDGVASRACWTGGGGTVVAAAEEDFLCVCVCW